jgi:hypothetical protein
MRSADIGALMSSQMLPFAGRYPTPILSAFFKVADPMFPLKAGDELFTDLPDAKTE